VPERGTYSPAEHGAAEAINIPAFSMGLKLGLNQGIDNLHLETFPQ
jgi:hypothetical protein